MRLAIRLEQDPRLTRALRRLAANAPARRRFLLDYSRLVQGIARSSYLSGGGNRLNVRTGALRRSVLIETAELPDAVTIGSEVVYAGVHEEGRTIRARAVPFLRYRLASGEFRRSPEVTIPARPWLEPSLADSAGRVEEFLLKALEEHLA